MEAFLVPSDRIIDEYLKERGFSQDNLSYHIGTNKETMSDFFNGRTRLTENIAHRLEHIMPNVDVGYWLNYEYKY